MRKFVVAACVMVMGPVYAQETLDPGTWTNVQIDGNRYCQRDTGELIDPDGSDSRRAVSRVCNDWTEFEAKIREHGIVLVKISPVPDPDPVPDPTAFIMPAVVGAIAGGEAEALIDMVAGTMANIDYQSICLGDVIHEVLMQSPEPGRVVNPEDEILLTVRTESICF